MNFDLETLKTDPTVAEHFFSNFVPEMLGLVEDDSHSILERMFEIAEIIGLPQAKNVHLIVGALIDAANEYSIPERFPRTFKKIWKSITYTQAELQVASNSQ